MKPAPRFFLVSCGFEEDEMKAFTVSVKLTNKKWTFTKVRANTAEEAHAKVMENPYVAKAKVLGDGFEVTT